MRDERPGEPMAMSPGGPVATSSGRPTATSSGTTSATPPAPGAGPADRSLVVCSLEPWTEVRRRLHILSEEMVADDPLLRLLYVAPALDPLHLLRTAPARVSELWRLPRLEVVAPRLRVLRPRKWAPRRLGPLAQRSLERQVLREVEAWGLRRPVLWVNDALFAPLVARTGWPSVYDVTDDWLLAELPPGQRARLEAAEQDLLERADAVVVCSPELGRTRGARRPAELIPNAVDVDRFRSPQGRPAPLPEGPVAVYVGSLQEERLDVELVVQLASERPDIQIVLVGPDYLSPAASARLRSRPNVHLTGPVPYEAVPGFLQHADVVVVPHRVNPFTESLDPIKAYECLAVGRPTVATPVAGFRELGPPVRTAARADFAAAVAAAVAEGPPPPGGAAPADPLPTWRDRAREAAAVVDRVREGRRAEGARP